MLVVGGGPAGSVTAMLLAREGFDVTLLDRYAFPRSKPCGDCLSPAANRVLMRLGVWDDVQRAAPAHLRGWRLFAPAGHSFSTTFDTVTGDPDVHTALAISRDRFDAVLLGHARGAGVAVRTGARVNEVIRNIDGSVRGVRVDDAGVPMHLHARFTVGADGLRSVIARRLHARARNARLRKVSITIHAELDKADDRGEMHVLPDGCIGIAPVTRGTNARTHNVTIVLNHAGRDAGVRARDALRARMRQLGAAHVADQFDDALTSGPFDWPTRRTVFDGAALVGDAAGYYDPFTGQGIFQALTTAEMLAENLSDALRRRRTVRAADLREFARMQKRMTTGARRVQRIVEFVCARPHLANSVFAKFARDPLVARALIGVTGDLLPAGSLLSPALLARLAR